MSIDRSLCSVPSAPKQVIEPSAYVDVADSLRRVGKSTVFSPGQIEIDDAIHLCFKSEEDEIDKVRLIVKYALDNPDSWLASHPRRHTLSKGMAAMQVRMGVHPDYPQPLLRDRYLAFGRSVKKSDRTVRGYAAEMIEEFARVLVDSPGQLVRAFRFRPRSMPFNGCVTIHSTVKWQALDLVDVDVYCPIASPYVTTSFELALPLKDTVVVTPHADLREIPVQSRQASMKRYEGSHLEAGHNLKLNLRQAPSVEAQTPEGVNQSPPKIFGTFGTGVDLHQSLYFLAGRPPLECYSIEVQVLPDGRRMLRCHQPENEGLQEFRSVTKVWQSSLPNTFYGFYMVWDAKPLPPLSLHIPDKFDHLLSWFRLRIVHLDEGQAAVA